MKNLLRAAICFLLCLLSELGFAQSGQGSSFPDTAFAIPSIIGSPRSKGIVMKQESLLGYKVRSVPGKAGVPAGEGAVEYNSRWEFKLRLPIISSPDLTFAMGLNYEVEEYSFRGAADERYFFYKSLERKPLRSTGGTLYLIKPFRGKNYFMFRGSGDINGDYNGKQQPTSKYLRISATPMFGWKNNANLSYAIGLSYNYRFGRATLIPLLSYNRNFNKLWTLEATLPTRVRLRYNHNPRTYFYFVSELNGANYNITLSDTTLDDYPDLYLQRGELRNLVVFERELYDWLWIGLETGMRTNIRYNLTATPRSNKDVILRNRLGNAFLFSFSAFIVPPRRFVKDKQ